MMRTYDETARRVLARRDEALASPGTQNIRWMRIAAAAACICVTASVGAFAIHRMNREDSDSMIVYQQGNSQNALAPAEEAGAADNSEPAPETVRETTTFAVTTEPATGTTAAKTTDAQSRTTAAPPQTAVSAKTSAANRGENSRTEAEASATGATTWQTTKAVTRQNTSTSLPVQKTIVSATTTSVTTNTEIAREKPWGEKLLPERFPTFDHPLTGRQIIYNLLSTTPLDTQMIGQNICTMTMRGFNDDTQQQFSVAADFFRLRCDAAYGIWETVLAVRFEGDDNYYPYVESWSEFDFRSIKTLEDYLKETAFEEYAEFGTIYDNNLNVLAGFTPAEIKEMVMEMLFPDEHPLRDYSCLELENGMNPDAALDIAVGLPDLGLPVRQSFKVTEDGWVEINLFGYGKRIHVDPERTKPFIDRIRAGTTVQPYQPVDSTDQIPE